MTAWLPADWPAPANVRAFTTLRHGAGVSQAPFDSFNLGSRCGDSAAAVASNRDALAKQARLPSTPRWLRQVHGTRVLRFDGDGAVDAATGDEPGIDTAAGDEPEADAAVTVAAGVVLAILSADCLPVLFSADDGSEIGAAHAGWRGLAAGVLEQVVAALVTPPQRLLAWLGPAAGPTAYEVGTDVFDAFVARDPRAASALVATRPGHWRVDLYALARLRLADAGVVRVSGGGLCTISDPARFYSHRRDQRTGRMATLIHRSEPAG